MTVSAGDDKDATDDSVTLVHTASGGNYNDGDGDGIPDEEGQDEVTRNVAVTVDDDDTVGITGSKSSVTVLEGEHDWRGLHRSPRHAAVAISDGHCEQ